MCGDRLYSEWTGHWLMLIPVRPLLDIHLMS